MSKHIFGIYTPSVHQISSIFSFIFRRKIAFPIIGQSLNAAVLHRNPVINSQCHRSARNLDVTKFKYAEVTKTAYTKSQINTDWASFVVKHY
jgi:hypothetical protein